MAYRSRGRRSPSYPVRRTLRRHRRWRRPTLRWGRPRVRRSVRAHRRSRRGLVLGLVAVLAGLSVLALPVRAARRPKPGRPPCVAVALTASSNELAPELPPEGLAAITAAALRNGYAEVLSGEGDGTVHVSRFELTPRRGKKEEKTKEGREALAHQNAEKVAAAVRAEAATRPGHATLALLQEVGRRPCSTVVLITSAIDTRPPLDLRVADWDIPLSAVVGQLRASDSLPRLGGKTVIAAITPPAGQQKPLTEATRRHLERLLDGILRSAEAKVRLVPSASSQMPRATAPVPPVPVPPPVQVKPLPTPPRPRPKGQCEETYRLPAVALFVADEARLLDPSKARDDLKPLATRALTTSASIELIGHTSLDSQGYSAGRALSLERAKVIQKLLIDLKVPSNKLVKVRGVGPTQPLVQPPSHPTNRAVVAVLTYRATTAPCR